MVRAYDTLPQVTLSKMLNLLNKKTTRQCIANLLTEVYKCLNCYSMGQRSLTSAT